jgi:hypothetical protein
VRKKLRAKKKRLAKHRKTPCEKNAVRKNKKPPAKNSTKKFQKNHKMKKIFFGAAALTLLALATNGCKEEEFDPTGTFEEIPVVYGLLNQRDTAHYIRIERAFLDAKTSALVLAKDTAALYFKNATVYLQRLANDGTILSDIPLKRVNGTLEGYPRNNGIFNSSPNYLYKTKATLQADTRYRLNVVVPIKGENKTFTAETKTLETFDWIDPATDFKLNLVPSKQTLVSWGKPQGTNATIYDLSVRVGVDETDGTSTTPVRRFYSFPIERNIVASTAKPNILEVKMDNNTFYKNLSAEIQKSPTNAGVTLRCSNSMQVEFFVKAGGSELAQYLTSSTVASGIASTDVVPKYTNIDKGRGLFSSIFSRDGVAVAIGKATVDELYGGNIVPRDLKFTSYISTAACP